jgi:hypothetical protein
LELSKKYLPLLPKTIRNNNKTPLIMKKISWIGNVSSYTALIPTDSHKSFYGKAEVITLKNGTRLLLSYSTIVAGITKSGKAFRSWCGWSATTGRHIKSFMGMNKKEWESLPFVEVC